MTNRRLLDPNSLPAEPSLAEIREVLVDLWDLASIHVTRETGDYTVTGEFSYMVILMANTAAATVTLKQSPLDFQRVTVVQTTDEAVTINGNGKTINNGLSSGSTLILSQVGSAPNLIFSEDDDEWWPI